MLIDKTIPAVTDLIPHRGSMLFLDTVLHADKESCTAQYTPQAGAWYLNANGAMPAWISIEIMAQTIAAHTGEMRRQIGLLPKQGVLLGTRSLKSTCPAFAPGVTLQIVARVSFWGEGGLAAYECSIATAAAPHEVLASAILKVFEPEDFGTFLEERVA